MPASPHTPAAPCTHLRPALHASRPARMAALALLAGGMLFLWQTCGPAQAALLFVGGALGLVLYHAAFGFTAAWRVFILKGRGAGLRAQMVLLTLSVLLFFPALGAGTLFGREITGSVSPAGFSVLAGAFMFGIGMQLGGGCASGTLFTLGGGSTRMLVTLAFFITGSVVATAHFSWWTSLPSLPRVSLVELLGPSAGILVSLGLFAAITMVTVLVEKRRHGTLETQPPLSGSGLSRLVKGPWPLLWGAVALAVLNFITLALSGHPWGITSAFALWGAKGAAMIGFEPAQWAYWQSADNARALASGISVDRTSIMNFGIIAGAMLAASLAGRFTPCLRIPPRTLIAATAGGLLMGYGARIAYGCNIGAYFSGIASGSLHGWVWLAAAFAGNIAGVRLRPLFFTGPPVKAQPAAC